MKQSLNVVDRDIKRDKDIIKMVPIEVSQNRPSFLVKNKEDAGNSQGQMSAEDSRSESD